MGNIRILITGSNGLLGQKIVGQLIAKQIDFLSIMRDQFGSSIFNAVFSLTSSIPNAASLYQTIYDTPMKDNKVSMMLNTIFKEMENEIRKCWPSHKRKLEEEGVI